MSEYLNNLCYTIRDDVKNVDCSLPSFFSISASQLIRINGLSHHMGVLIAEVLIF